MKETCSVVKIFALFACLLLNSCAQSDHSKKDRADYLSAREKNSRPIILTLRIIDQDGIGAKNYGFKMAFTRTYKFLWLFWPGRAKCFHVNTDENGYIRLNWPAKSADSVLFKETDIGEYIFSKSLEKIGGLPMPSVTDAQSPLELKVIRHGPIQKLQVFSTPSQEYSAKDVNIFTIDPNNIVPSPFGLYNLTSEIHPENKVPEEGFFYIKVENAREAVSAKMAFLGWSKEKPSQNPIPWTVSVGGHGRFLLRETNNEYVSFAPTDRYQESLNWSIQYWRNEGDGLEKYFFVKDSMNGKYFWFRLALGFRNDNKFDLHYDAVCNPDGSNNLYQDRWPDKAEFKRYSERCP